jgi:hypothetical protein
VDDITALLDRAVTPQVSSAVVPPVAVIEVAANRRQLRRSMVSLTVVLLLVIGCVIGFAGIGHASETSPVTTAAAGAAPPVTAHT